MADAGGSSIVIAAASVVLGGLTAYVTASWTARRNAGVAASEKEIVVRAQLVQDLAKRQGELESALQDAWERERDREKEHREALEAVSQRERQTFENYRRDLIDVERRWRHLAADLIQHIIALRRMLRERGVRLPRFTALDRFEAEGGRVREEWVRAIAEEPDGAG